MGDGLADFERTRLGFAAGRDPHPSLVWLDAKGRAAVRAAYRFGRRGFNGLDRTLAVRAGDMHGSASAQDEDNTATLSPAALRRSISKADPQMASFQYAGFDARC